ncbi:MAG: AMMECR1 domain-containing protein [Paraclostridium sp.]
MSVDLLYSPEVTTFDKLDVINYGVIVSSGNRRGLLLPNLEGVDTTREQVDIALQKGNISPDENYILERFKVEKFREN